jgi:integration host factor subunit beta
MMIALRSVIFSSFSVIIRPPRTARNPKTGEKVDVTVKHVPHFKPGLELKKRVM